MSAPNADNGEPPPQHVLAAFGLGAEAPERFADGRAWYCDEVVLRPVGDRKHAVWLGTVLDRLDVPELRIARPVRSTDGRTLISGWQAYRYLNGTPAADPDSLILTSIKLHEATAQLPEPLPEGSRDGIGAEADRLAWGEQDTALDEQKGGRWFEILSGVRRPVSLPDQLVHGQLYDTVLFDEEGTPGVVDFVPYYRPAEWATAVAAVDAMAAGAAEGELLRRWAHLPEWSQMLLRAILFRLAYNALDPYSTRDQLDGLRGVAHIVSELL